MIDLSSDMRCVRADATMLSEIRSLAQQANVYVPNVQEMSQTLVLRVGSVLVGFATWQVVCDEATLLAIAVATDYQTRGFGRQLLVQCLCCWQQHAVKQAFLEVRANNYVAQRLYDRLGFERIGSRIGYYVTDDGREDALVMRCVLGAVA